MSVNNNLIPNSSFFLLSTPLSPYEFKGTSAQNEAISRMDPDRKLEFIKELSPVQRRNLSPRLVAFFYNSFSKQNIPVNKRHYANTLAKLPSLPETPEDSRVDALLELFLRIKANDPEATEMVAKKDSVIQTVDRFEAGINGLITTVKNFEAKQTKESSNDDDDSVEEDSDDHTRDAAALQSLIGAILKLIEEQKLGSTEILGYLRDMTSGGLFCDRGQFTQSYTVYMKLLKMDSPEHTVLKFLHDMRDGIVDYIATQNPQDSTETVEVKSELVESFGAEIGLLSSLILGERPDEEERIDYTRVGEPAYEAFLMRKVKEDHLNDEQIKDFYNFIQSQTKKHKVFLTEFSKQYNAETIVRLLAQNSVDIDLYKWFLANPKEGLSKDDQHDYVLANVVDTKLNVKEEYIMQMLDELEVLSF